MTSMWTSVWVMPWMLAACDPGVPEVSIESGSVLALDRGLVARPERDRTDLPTKNTAGDTTGSATTTGTDLPPEGDVGDDGVDLVPEGVVGVVRSDASGTRRVFARRRPGTLFTELVVSERIGEGWVEEVRIAGTPNPDRPAISPDGENIAFVTGISGVASVWVLPFDGGADPIQVTNVGLERVRRRPSEPPAGFVPPPVAADGLRFSGDWLEWDGPEGEIVARWRW